MVVVLFLKGRARHASYFFWRVTASCCFTDASWVVFKLFFTCHLWVTSSFFKHVIKKVFSIISFQLLNLIWTLIHSILRPWIDVQAFTHIFVWTVSLKACVGCADVSVNGVMNHECRRSRWLLGHGQWLRGHFWKTLKASYRFERNNKNSYLGVLTQPIAII